jgi:hypothetical protein
LQLWLISLLAAKKLLLEHLMATKNLTLNLRKSLAAAVLSALITCATAAPPDTAPTSAAASKSAESDAKNAGADNDRQKRVDELLAWATASARDAQLSADPLARAMANDLSQLLSLAEQNSAPSNSEFTLLDKNDRLALYDVRTPMPVRLWHFWAGCLREAGSQCTDPALEKSLVAGDAGNAFVLLAVRSVADNVSRGQMYTQMAQSEAGDSCIGAAADLAAKPACTDQAKRAARNAAKERAAAFEKAQTERTAEWLKRFDVATRYDDFAQDFKAPVLAMVKKRPLPPGWTALIDVPAEYAALVSGFPEEQWMAEVLSNAIVGSAVYASISAVCTRDGASNSSNSNTETANAAPSQAIERCGRVAGMVLRNPKNSFASAVAVIEHLQTHPIQLRAKAFNAMSELKNPQLTDVFKLDWLSLRELLARAIRQGDVAAIPGVFSWLDAQAAKIADKTAADVAKETAERKAIEDAMAADIEQTRTTESRDKRHGSSESRDERHGRNESAAAVEAANAAAAAAQAAQALPDSPK